MQAFHGLAPLAAVQIGMNHFSDNRTWADDGHLHHNIVKTFWLEAWQAGHLRAAFHLKQSNRIRALQSRINFFIILRQKS
jgi:hypothetical protein